MNQSAGRTDGCYKAWLHYRPMKDEFARNQAVARYEWIACGEQDQVMTAAVSELANGIESMLGIRPHLVEKSRTEHGIIVGTFAGNEQVGSILAASKFKLGQEGFAIKVSEGLTVIGAHTSRGVLYGVFHLLRLMAQGNIPGDTVVLENPASSLRMINHWDNINGSIERGYAGKSIFYAENTISYDPERVKDYARLLASVGINAIVINNVNVHQHETKFLTETYLPQIAELASIFRAYGLRLYLSINFASPMEIGGLGTADPVNSEVRQWWKDRTAEIYRYIPDFGGFLVKADSEHRPGPFTYGRDHADGANMLAEALAPYGGLVVWRCFVYNCKQDWRDRSTDRAKAAYDHFMPLDGKFADNVILQIKNGPMDFQVREPVSPLFGAMQHTHQIMEFQITQEYTGQQRHLCYLVPQWKEVLEFPTYAAGDKSPVKKIVDGTVFGRNYNGFAAVSNIGSDMNWTGHPLAQANLYGYGRLAWNPDLSAEDIAMEWIKQTIVDNGETANKVCAMLMSSLDIYESYTAPLGVGWMVNPSHHYGPNVDGYEYDRWGTYHFADCHGIGVDRTVKTGTGYAAQYMGKNAENYESLEQCPDELLLFFHHVPYTHKLKSGVTVIQHIYNTHFEGAECAAGLVSEWKSLEGQIDEELYAQVEARLIEQADHAKEWCDVINTYSYRKSGIADELGRQIY